MELKIFLNGKFILFETYTIYFMCVLWLCVCVCKCWAAAVAFTRQIEGVSDNKVEREKLVNIARLKLGEKMGLGR